MWMRIAAGLMLVTLLFCQASGIGSASSVMPTPRTTNIVIQWDPPEPE